MRANGAVRASVGDVSLELGPEPAQPIEPSEPMTDADVIRTAEEQRKAHDAVLFAHVLGHPLLLDSE